MPAVRTATGAIAALATAATVLAGPLTPPAGAPAPTNLTLAEIEPRTPLATAGSTIVITEPGSYYLTENINAFLAGIEVQTDGVTIDLNGFSIIGDNAGPATDIGIRVTAGAGARPIVIKNGSIQAFAGTGINASAAAIAVVIDHVHIVECLDGAIIAGPALISNSSARDCTLVGFRTNAATTFSNCLARDNGADGFQTTVASVQQCVSTDNGGAGFSLGGNSTIHNSNAGNNAGFGITGFNTAVTHCTTIVNGTGGIEVGVGGLIANCRTGQEAIGITAGVGSTVVACTARSCTTGFSIGQGSHVTDSTAKDCSQDGFSLATEVRLTHCLADNNNVGIRGASACHIEQNTATNNTTTGIIAGAGTLLVRNAATGNASAFDTTGANAGPVETSAATATSPWANLAY